MRKLIDAVLFLAASGYFVQQNPKLKAFVEGLTKQTRATVESDQGGYPAPPPFERRSNTIRIGSFNIQVFGEKKISHPHVMDILADIVRRFDVIAIQEVRSVSNDILPTFVELINSTGRHYDFVIGPRLGRTSSKEQYAFIYDAASIEVDREAVYTVEDRDDQLHREPLVGWFRVRGPKSSEAFTFTLIDIHTDPDETRTELNALADVYRAVREDGRGEDDTILLGDLNVDDRHLGRLGEISNIATVISHVPTNTHGDRQYDNMVFQVSATSEFTGRGGVFDMIREYNLTVAEALEVSDHMPIWAEFSTHEVLEGSQSGRFAARPKAER